MSFAIITAGTPADVLRLLDSDPGPIKPHGGTLGLAFRNVIAEIAEHGPADKMIYVEANGHGDPSNTSMDLKIRTIHQPAVRVPVEAFIPDA